MTRLMIIVLLTLIYKNSKDNNKNACLFGNNNSNSNSNNNINK